MGREGKESSLEVSQGLKDAGYCRPEEYCVAVKLKKDTVGSCKCGANMVTCISASQLRYELTDYFRTLICCLNY